ncbi:MAG: amidohydrolase family protein [Thalassobaculum sp.]|uniref:amidohydrolase family protein n=1 Tax=Thalassobaculum sp. TaxID=2022740 RepID=UPI0032EE304D
MTDADLPIIDAHHHFWDLGHDRYPWLEEHVIPFRYGDYASLRRHSYLVEDFRRDHGSHNVVKSIHMEAEWDPRDPVAETRWLHELHDRTGWPHACVGQAWFGREDIAGVLAGHAGFPLVRSVRQKPAAAKSPDAFVAGAPGSMADPAFRAGYGLLARHGLHYDLQTPWWHLGEAADLARDFPDTLIVLNHTGLPSDRSAAGMDGWREAMAAFAAQPNTAVKISGIGLPGQPWTPAAQSGVVLDTIRLFGPDRCMVASNFPVDSLCASYDEIFAGLKAITAGLPPADRRAVFHDTADRVYRPV